MADKQLSLKQHADDGFFADDDPLAALAQIANFDPQGEVRPRPVSQRREPEFNLEDELLKEFEQYEEPEEAAPTPEIMSEVLAEEARPIDPRLIESEAAFADQLIEPVSEPVARVEHVEPVAEVRDFPELRAVPPLAAPPVEPTRPVSHPVFDLEDEIFKEFAAFDARRGQPIATVTPAEAFVTPVEPTFEPELKAEPVFEPKPEPVVEPEAVFESAPAVDQVYPETAEDFDISDDVYADEVETLVHDDVRPDHVDADRAAAPLALQTPASANLDVEALDAMEAEIDPGLWHDSTPAVAEQEAPSSDRADHAVFGTDTHFEADAGTQERWDDELSVEASVDAMPLELDIDAEPEPDLDFAELTVEDLTTEDMKWSATPVAPAPFVRENPAKETVATPSADSRKEEFGLDALLADVDRYPIGAAATKSREATAAPPVVRAPISLTPLSRAPFVPEQPKAEPVRVAETAVKAVEVASPPVAGMVADPAAAVAPVRQVPAAEPESFDEAAFELDLTEIELDLLEMEVADSLAPALHADQISDEPKVSATPAALARIENVQVVERPAFVTPERAVEPQTKFTEDYSSLPFDPSQVSTEEDPLEAIAELDVPDAPVVDHHEVHAPAPQDYDIDIDSEMAHLFGRPVAKTPQALAASAVKQPQPVSESVDLDEFERALEEDFRRSLSENRAQSAPDRVALTPSQLNEVRREGSTSRRILVLAASVAGLVLIGGAGVYAFLGHGAGVLSASGEPKIILADKDPVKVAPVNRGGQIVPNQDKAVYDRVSGDQKNVPQQEKLVTSNEEPVDVVQKTLMPENLPLDEDQASATDTGDTTDPRLLPENKAANVTTENANDGVSPRKVRTMVVRADGTLVPRDEEPVTEDASRDLTPAEASQDRPLDVTPAAADENVPERLAANDDIAKQINQASADETKGVVPGADKPAKIAADAQPVATDTAKVADDSAAKQPDIAPVEKQDLAAAVPADTAQDAAQDAAKDTTNTDVPADNTVADKPADTKPVDQAAINDAAAADVKDTTNDQTSSFDMKMPIPETRPADQPVDIVGRVANEAKPKKADEVASAEPAMAQPTATAPGSYVIQIASLPSQADAQNSYNKLSVKFASVIGGRGVDIRKAEIKKGTYYRVRIPAGSRDEANALCSRYKAAGGSCLVSK